MTFSVHEPILQARTRCFNNVLEEARSIDGPRIICMPKEDPETLNVYLSFVYEPATLSNYNKRIADGAVPTGRYDFHEYFDPEFTALTKVYVLARKLGDREMMHDVFHAITELSDMNFFFGGKLQPAAAPVDATQILWVHLSAHSEDYDLRYEVVKRFETYGCHGSDHSYVLFDHMGIMPFDFMTSVMATMYDDRLSSKEWEDMKDLDKQKDEEIQQLKARIAMLESRE